jgi:hypothetical protein
VVALAASANLVASLALAALCAKGTAAGGTLEERVAFVAAHPLRFGLGWGTWIAATAGLVVIVWALGATVGAASRPFANAAVLLMLVGAVPDITNDLIQISVLPLLAERAEASAGPFRAHYLFEFELWDRLAVSLTGGFANLFYAAGGYVLTAALLRDRRFPRRLTLFGLAPWTGAIVMAGLSLAYAGKALVPVVGVTMAAFVLWAGGLSLCLLREGKEP